MARDRTGFGRERRTGPRGKAVALRFVGGTAARRRFGDRFAGLAAGLRVRPLPEKSQDRTETDRLGGASAAGRRGQGGRGERLCGLDSVRAGGYSARLSATSVVQTGLRGIRSEEHTSELQSLRHLVCRL